MALKFADLCHLGLLSDEEVKGLVKVTGEFNTAAEVANLTEDEWNGAIAAIKLGDKLDSPSIAQKARYRNLLKLAVESTTKKEVKVTARKCKLSSVLDQTCDAEVVRLDAETISNLYHAYEVNRGGVPHSDHDPSVDQLSAYHQALGDGSLPYADFAVFGPHGDRLARKLRFANYTMNPVDGVWTRTELPGPPDFQTWWKCFRTYKTLLLLLDLVDIEPIDNYGEKVRDLHDTFGPPCWFIIYQADSRMRSEQFERIRRRLDSDYNKVTQAGGSTKLIDFDPKKPWNGVLREAASDTEFWTVEVKDKAYFFLTAVRTSQAVREDGTAQPALKAVNLSSTPAGSPGSSAAPPVWAPEPPAKRQKSNRVRDGARTGADGLFTHNRAGNEVCKNFNEGVCSLPCPGGRVHQCAKCLQTGHTAKDCGRNRGKGQSKGKASRKNSQ
eukprot:6490615-Amphidinium_carterae.1